MMHFSSISYTAARPIASRLATSGTEILPFSISSAFNDSNVILHGILRLTEIPLSYWTRKELLQRATHGPPIGDVAVGVLWAELIELKKQDPPKIGGP